MIEGEDYIIVKKTFLEGNDKKERLCAMVLLFEDVIYPEEYTGELLDMDAHGDITVVHSRSDDNCILMNFDDFTELWMKWKTKDNLKIKKGDNG